LVGSHGEVIRAAVVASRQDASIVTEEERMRFTLRLGLLSVALVALASGGLARDAEVLASATAAPGYEIVELVRGSALHGANGVYFGPDGNLYVAVFAGSEIVALDPQSGEIVARFGRDQGVLAPDDVVFGPDGSMYWTDIFVGEVGRRAPDGMVTKQFVAQGVNPITFNDQGRLFVALDFLGDGLYELDPGLIEPPRSIVVATETVPFPLGFLNGFDFGPDGRLYGPLFAAGMVISIDVDSCNATSDPWNDCDLQVVAADFGVPAAAKFDPTGRLHVVDQTGEVFRVDVPTGEKTRIAALQPGLDNLAFDDRGNLFVSSADFGWVAQIEDDGQARYLTRGGPIVPQGLAILPGPEGRDRVFVADVFRLYEFDGRNGQELAVFKGHLLADPALLTTPMNLSADGEHVVVSSLFGSAVQVWDPSTGAVLEHYDMPAPVHAIRFQGDLVVPDLTLGGVVWASDMSMLLAADFESVFLPTGLATDGERLWVGDLATGIVWQLEFDGRNVISTVPIASDLAQPEGMALDVDGSLLVVETGTRQLSRVDLATGAVSVVATGLDVGMPGLEGFPPTWWFDGVAVGPSGAIYVTENGRNVLTRIVRR
jgi:sugar lactone lactonase YvrE